jgi:hypothetical protein
MGVLEVLDGRDGGVGAAGGDSPAEGARPMCRRASALTSMPAGPSSPAPARERLTVVGADVTDTVAVSCLFIGNSPVGA